MTRFILASGSPRRKNLLSEAGQDFSVVKTDADESVSPSLTPEQTVKELARRKAMIAFSKYGEPVLAADTLVVCNGEILGKPSTESEAKEYLHALSGKVHQVVTGVCVVTADGGRTESATAMPAISVLANTWN
ncbi:MAG: Maf family protein, partial [Clostridia bacterium]|nr:Maf family protein [Clostridia bacterium]